MTGREKVKYPDIFSLHKKERKPTILHIITNVHIGGAERALLRAMRLYNRDKFNHIIVTLLPPGRLFEQFKKEDVEIHSLNMKSYFDFRSLPKYIQILREKKPITVVAYLFHALSFAVIGKIVYPHTILIHNKRNITMDSTFRDILTKFYTFLVDYLIVVSKGTFALESKAKFRPGINSFLVYNGITMPKIQKKRKTKDKIIIGTIGRLHYQKGLSYLLESALLLKSSGLKVKFIIIGGGEKFAELKEIIDRKGLSDIVELKGEKINIEPYLKIFDIFVLPSLYEGFSNVILEAMAYEIPVIGTNVCGTKEVINHNKNGLLIEPKSSKEIAAAVTKLANNAKLRKKLGREGRKTVENHFTIQKTVDKLESIFSQIISNHTNLKIRNGI